VTTTDNATSETPLHDQYSLMTSFHRFTLLHLWSFCRFLAALSCVELSWFTVLALNYSCQWFPVFQPKALLTSPMAGGTVCDIRHGIGRDSTNCTFTVIEVFSECLHRLTSKPGESHISVPGLVARLQFTLRGLHTARRML
jgi:hypothetical protein